MDKAILGALGYLLKVPPQAVKYKFCLTSLLKSGLSVFYDCILPSKQGMTWIQLQAQLV